MSGKLSGTNITAKKVKRCVFIWPLRLKAPAISRMLCAPDGVEHGPWRLYGYCAAVVSSAYGDCRITCMTAVNSVADGRHTVAVMVFSVWHIRPDRQVLHCFPWFIIALFVLHAPYLTVSPFSYPVLSIKLRNYGAGI